MRYHLFDTEGRLDNVPSIEGVETGVSWDGRNYKGLKGVLLNGTGRTPLEGNGAYEVPVNRVFFRQVLK